MTLPRLCVGLSMIKFRFFFHPRRSLFFHPRRSLFFHPRRSLFFHPRRADLTKERKSRGDSSNQTIVMTDYNTCRFHLLPLDVMLRVDHFISSAPTDCRGWVVFLKTQHRNHYLLTLLDIRMKFGLGSDARLKRYLLNNQFCVSCGSERLERGSDTCFTCVSEGISRERQKVVFDLEIERYNKKRKRALLEIEKLQTMRDYPWLTPEINHEWAQGRTKRRREWGSFRTETHSEFRRLLEKTSDI